MSATETLATVRREVAQEAYEAFAFDHPVAAANGFEDIDAHTLRRAVFLEVDPATDSVLVRFNVRFAPRTDALVRVWVEGAGGVG